MEAGEPLLPRVRALRFLPPDVAFAVVAEGIRPIADRIGLSRWIGRVRAALAPKLDALAALLGKDPSSPETIAEFGIDVDEPVGAALVLHGETMFFVVFGSVAKAGAFEETVGRVAGNLGLAAIPRDSPGGRILALGDPAVLHLVLRDGLFFAVAGLPESRSPGAPAETPGASAEAGTTPDDAGAGCARRIATLDAGTSLASSARFRGAFEGFSFGRHAAAYLDLERWTEASRRLPPASDAASQSVVERVLAESVRAIEGDAGGGLTDELVARILRSLDTVSAGLEFADRSVLLRVRAALKPGSWLAGLAAGDANGQGGRWWAPAERPAWVLHSDLGRDFLLAAVETALSLGDMTLDDLRANVAQAARLDLDRDVLPLLTGAVSVAVTADLSRPFWEEVDPFREVGLTVVLGLRDEDAATRFPLEALLGAPPFAGRTTPDGTTGGFVVDAPGWRPLHVDRVGTSLLVSTDPGLAAAVASGAPRATFLDSLDAPVLRETLRMPGTIALQIQDEAWFDVVTAISAGRLFGGPPGAGPLPSGDKPAEDPQQREFEALSRQLTEMRRAHFWESVREQIARERRFGCTAQALRIVPGIGPAGALEVHGGWFFAEESIPALIERVFEDDERRAERERQQSAEEGPLADRVQELSLARYRARSGVAQPPERCRATRGGGARNRHRAALMGGRPRRRRPAGARMRGGRFAMRHIFRGLVAVACLGAILGCGDDDVAADADDAGAETADDGGTVETRDAADTAEADDAAEVVDGDPGTDPLPEGPTGIAARFPGDVDIATDPDVIFADDFESYGTPDDLWSRWDNVFQMDQIRLAREAENVHSGAQALEFTIPVRDSELSNAVDKVLVEERDVLFLRYYSKFNLEFDVVGSSHNGSMISAHYVVDGHSTPGIPADGYNKFLAGFESWRGEASEPNPGYLNVYIYHPLQRSEWGDHFFPDGRVMPNTSLPFDFGPHFVPRPNVNPELGRWYAYEFMVRANTVGANDGRIACWVDGVLIADFQNLALRYTDVLKIDRFGLSLHAGSNPRSVARKWYDDVVAATRYIGPRTP